MSGRARRAALAALALVVVACTTGGEPAPIPAPTAAPTPTPTTPEQEGLRVAVVLPLAGEQPTGPAEARAAVGDLRVATRDDLLELRAVQPDGPAFVRDLVALLAGQGYDLVCAMGAGAREAVLELAADHPEVRFCVVAGGGPEDAPGNVHLLDIALGEAAYLAGAAVGATIAPSPLLEEGEPRPVPVGLIGPTGSAPSTAERAAFEQGVRRGVDRPLDVRVVTAASEDLASRIAELVDGGAPVVVGGPGVPLAALQQGAADADGLAVATVDARATIDGPTTAVLAIVRLDLRVALEMAVRALVDGEPPGVARLGVADGAVGVTAGGATRAEAAVTAARAAADDLAEGRVTLP